MFNIFLKGGVIFGALPLCYCSFPWRYVRVLKFTFRVSNGQSCAECSCLLDRCPRSPGDLIVVRR